MVEKQTVVTKEVKETKTIAGPVVSQRVDEKQNADIDKLKKDIGDLKKKGKNKKTLSEYNLFVKRQLKAGRTFAQAVKLWKRQLKVTKRLKKKSALKTVKGKTMAQKARVKKTVVKKSNVKKVKKPLAKKVVKKTVKKPVATKKTVKMVKPKVKIVKRIVKKIVRQKPKQSLISENIFVKSREDSKRLEEIALMISKTKQSSMLRKGRQCSRLWTSLRKRALLVQ